MLFVDFEWINKVIIRNSKKCNAYNRKGKPHGHFVVISGNEAFYNSRQNSKGEGANDNF